MKYFWIVLFCVFSLSCKIIPEHADNNELNESDGNEIVSHSQKVKVVTVVDKTGLDGCTFLLQLNDSSLLEPINLDDSYKINGTKLAISYRVVSVMSVCMAGTTVKLLTVELMQ